MWDTQFSGTSLKVDENPADVLIVMLRSSSGQTGQGFSKVKIAFPLHAISALNKTGASWLKRQQDFHPPSSWYVLENFDPTTYMNAYPPPRSSLHSHTDPNNLHHTLNPTSLHTRTPTPTQPHPPTRPHLRRPGTWFLCPTTDTLIAILLIWN